MNANITIPHQSYESPQAEIIALSQQDVVCSSSIQYFEQYCDELSENAFMGNKHDFGGQQ